MDKIVDIIKATITKYTAAMLVADGQAPTADSTCAATVEFMNEINKNGSLINTSIDNIDAIPVSKMITRNEASLEIVYNVVTAMATISKQNRYKFKTLFNAIVSRSRKLQDMVNSLLMLSDKADGFIDTVTVNAADTSFIVQKYTDAYINPLSGEFECARINNVDNIVTPDMIKNISAAVVTGGYTNLNHGDNNTLLSLVVGDSDNQWITSVDYPIGFKDSVSMEINIELNKQINISGLSIVTDKTEHTNVNILYSADGVLFTAIPSSGIILHKNSIDGNLKETPIKSIKVIYTKTQPDIISSTSNTYKFIIQNINIHRSNYAAKSAVVIGPIVSDINSDNIKISLHADYNEPKNCLIKYQVGMESSSNPDQLYFQNIIPLNSNNNGNKIIYTPFNATPSTSLVTLCSVDLTVQYPYYSNKILPLYTDSLNDGTLSVDDYNGSLFVVISLPDKHYTTVGDYFFSYCFIDNSDGKTFDAFGDHAYVNGHKITSPAAIGPGWVSIAVDSSSSESVFESWLTSNTVVSGYKKLSYTTNNIFVNKETYDRFTVIDGKDVETQSMRKYILIYATNIENEEYRMVFTDNSITKKNNSTNVFNSTSLQDEVNFTPNKFYIKAILNSDQINTPTIKSISLRLSKYKVQG